MASADPVAALLVEDNPRDATLAEWHRREHRRLRNRMEALEQQLRLRTILLTAAVAVCVMLGSFVVSSFYRSTMPRVALTVIPASSSTSETWKLKPPARNEQSHFREMGEKWIEASALLRLYAREVEGTPAELTKTSRTETSGVGAVGGRDCLPGSPATNPGPSPREDELRKAREVERAQYAATNPVNLRAAPDNSALILAVVAQGDVVRRTGRDVGWLQVEYGDHSVSGIKGWVYSDHLRPVDAPGEPLPARPEADLRADAHSES